MLSPLLCYVVRLVDDKAFVRLPGDLWFDLVPAFLAFRNLQEVDWSELSCNRLCSYSLVELA